MVAGLRALLVGLIDYAGLFPPARLPLEQALRHYADYRREADAWMLGRFVLPASRLAELDDFADRLFTSDRPFAAAVLGRGGATPAEFVAGLEADLRDIAVFRGRHGDRVTVDVMEARLPAGLDVVEVARRAQAAKLLFFGEGAGDVLDRLASARRTGLTVGFKLRCGGLEAVAFPASEQVATALRACLDDGLPFKATAGLHHPLPRLDAALGVPMYGFVNLFLAGVLARTHQLNAGQIAPLLDEDDPGHFSFDDAGAGWRDLRATTADIEAARREFVLSFGSCSFDEPREDLRALGWLDAEGGAR